MIALLASGSVLFLLDQWSKRMIQDRSYGRLLRIRRVLSAKHLYKKHSMRLFLVLVWVAALISAIILYRTGARFQSPAALIGLGAAFGGAAGNLLDILRRRSVVDFIDLGWWPVFNFADIGIVGGLAAAFLFHP